MAYECIIFEKQESIAIIKLNRPKVLNAMNKQLWLDMQTAMEDVRTDPKIRVMIITGEGRAFSTGADLKESKTRSIEAYRDYLAELQEASRKLIRFEKPTIAAINGYALGSGYELALACDIRIAADEAQIGSPEAKVTSSVTGGAMRLVQDLIGPGVALYRRVYLRQGGRAHRPGEPQRTAGSADGGMLADGRQDGRQLGLFHRHDQEGAFDGPGRGKPRSVDGLRGGSLSGMRFHQRTPGISGRVRRPQEERLAAISSFAFIDFFCGKGEEYLSSLKQRRRKVSNVYR